jgi:hypothetical protein
MKHTEYLRADRALDVLLHQGGRIIRMHTSLGSEWFLLPGGARIKPSDAEKIIRRADVIPSGDGLLAGHTQTYRRRLPAPDDADRQPASRIVQSAIPTTLTMREAS